MSGQLKEIRTRIGSVKSTQKITKAMKLVAASKLRRAQDRIIKIRPYAQKLYDILTNIASGAEGDVSIDLSVARPVEKVLIIAVTSDRGLCGGFNGNIFKVVTQTIKEKYATQYEAGKVEVMCIGKKGHDLLRKDELLAFDTNFLDIFKDLNFAKSAEISEKVIAAFLSGEYDVIEVAYNRFHNQITQVPTTVQYLPIEKLETKVEENTKAIQADFIYEPNQTEILEELVPKILKTQFFRYLLESNASEQGARMTAMDNATENAEELLKSLKLTFNRARQAAITTEIAEIVGGAAALQGG